MIDPITKFFCLIMCLMTLNFAPYFSLGCGGRDTDIIAHNIAAGLLDGTVSPFEGSDINDGAEIISLIVYDEDGDCYFSDIDYSAPDRSSWPAARHIKRAERLAVLYRTETDGEKKEEYRAYVLELLDYWLKKDYQNSNWWHNKLSNPNILGELGILMKDELNGDRLLKLSAFVGRGCFLTNPMIFAYTGANTIDLAMSTIKFGALTGSGAAIRLAANAVSGELDYSSGEGMKEDHTYFQHGNRLYMGGYGAVFINGMANITAMLSGTRYIFTREQLEPFAAFILDGLRIMSFGSTLDPVTMGRSVSRVNAQPLRGLTVSLKKLAALDEMPRKDELNAYIDSILTDEKQNYGLRYFDDAKFLVINTPDFYFSFRGGNSTMVYSEVINDENVLGYNSSVPGVTTIMHTGREYTDISPVFDYALVPGVTSVYENDEQLLSHGDFSYRALPGVYGSACKDGAAVLSAKTVREGISSTVSCFAVNNAAVLLGAGLKDSKNRQLYTTLNQCFANGETLGNGNTVIHGGIKYTVYEGGAITAETGLRTGDWHRNNLPYRSIPASGSIFTAYLTGNNSYAFSVMGENTDAVFEVIENSENVQAVKLPDGRIAAAFFAKTSFTCGGKTYSGKAGDAVIYN